MDSIGEEREQIEDDIERLNLALQVEGSTVELNDEEEEELDDIFTNEDSIDPDDYESVNTIPSQDSEPTHVETSEIDQMSGMSEISHLPINAETCLALNRTYQELILESLKKIELALNENREKQKVLEEGLETKSKGAPKTTDKSTTNKKKSSAMFCKPYFKDKDQKVAPHNSDVEMKKMTQEHKQDVSPPQAWSIAQRCKLQEAIKAEGLKQKIVPLLNRKEILVEKVKHIETELMKISIESFKNEENVTDDEEESEHLTGTREIKEQDLVELKQKIEEVDKEMEKAKQTSEIELLFNLDSEKVDWLMIANVIFDGKRDERECRIMWKNVLHPSINKEKWSAQETKDLQELANKYNMRNWPAIAKELGTGRTPFQCLQFYQHSLNETWNNRPWTEEEDEMLREVVESVRMGNRISFAQVSYFLDGRSQSQCTSRWNQINPSMKRGRWSLHEDCLLITAVQLHGPKNWRLIKEYVHGRTPIQCRDRYNNCLNPSINAAQTWSYEDDKLLLKRVNSQLEKGSSVSWVKILPEFPGRIDGQLLSRYRRLQAWKMKSEWVEKQSEQEKKNMGVLEGEQLLREITKEEPTTSFLEMSKSFPDVCKEDYLKQIEDRRRGDLVVPRPPVMTHCATRCVQALWTRKKHLFSLVDQHLKNMDKLVPDHSTNIKEFKMFESLSKIQEKILRETMAKHPSDITVKDMLKISKKLTRTESCKDGRTKWIERDLICDDQIKDILIWKCFHSLLVDKRCGRPRKFYLFSPTGRKPPCAEEDDDEDVEKITDITVTLLMNALDVDHKSALEKSRELDPNSSTVGEEIDLLRRVTPNILPSNVTQTQPTIQIVSTTLNQSSSTNSQNQSSSTNSQNQSSSTNSQNQSSSTNSQNQSSSTNSQNQSSSTNSQNQSSSTSNQNQSSSTSNQNQSSSTSNQNQSSITNEQSNSSHENSDTAQTTNCGSALGRKRKVAVGTDQDAQVQSKKSKAISSSSNENANSSCNGKESSSVVQKNSNGCTEKNLNSVGVVGQGSSTPVANINRTSSSLGENPSSKTNMSALPAGARIIRLPPGVKLKPGDKIQDILAAHKLSMAALESQPSPASPVPDTQCSQTATRKQPVVPIDPSQTTTSKQPVVPIEPSQTTTRKQPVVPIEPGSRKKKKKSKSQPQKQSVVVLRPPSGIQDPKRVKILPPGTITTCAFKSVMLHRKYLMIRADELYSRQFYRLRGNELQKRVTLELSKQATGAVKIERNENEQHVGALNKTLYTMEKSVASSVAAKTARIKQKGEVGHDALAKVRKTKEFKMLQKRFEALFAWPALLSTISPPFISGQRGRPSSVSAQKSKKGKNKKPSSAVDEQTENDAKSEMEMEQPVKRKKPKLSYPCINRKYSWKRNVLSKEAKRLKKEARMKKLRETRERKLRGEYVPQKTRKRQPKTTATIRQSQRVAVKRSMTHDSQTQEDAPVIKKELKKVVKKKKKSQNEDPIPSNGKFQLLPGDAVMPVALISNIASSIDNNSIQNAEGGSSVTIPQTLQDLQQLTASINSNISFVANNSILNTGSGSSVTVPPTLLGLQQPTASSSNILPSSAEYGTSQRTSVPPQQVSLPFVSVTDINIQTVPPTENPGAPPFIFAIVPSATGDGQVLQAVPNSVLKDAVNSSNQVIPDQDQAKPD
ncbi:uncharacterized protein LOC128155662 [Crassostrea angulata]|uniref:uncharacterized protein LOC128155662 n=1 Tax=Magallana angulata TaxID=2784310 RepID=UPI0022B1A11B|nr:uncharacterized protein LOC128155662 [Crassostrea angulata]